MIDESDDYTSGRADSESGRIKTGFFDKTARAQSESVTQQAPVMIVLVIVGIGVLFGLYQGLMYLVNFDKNVSMRNVFVKLTHPVQKDGAAFVDVVIENCNPTPVADVVVAYTVSGVDGKSLASGRVTVPAVVPAGDTRSYSHIELGPVAGQAGRMRGDLADLKVVGKSGLTAEQYNLFIHAAAMPDKEAVEAYKSFVKSAPDFAPGYVGLGQALAAAGDFDLAIKSYEKAIRIDPEMSSAHYNLGVAYYYKKDLEKARQELAEAGRLEPGDPSVQRALKQIGGGKDPAATGDAPAGAGEDTAEGSDTGGTAPEPAQ